MNARPVKHSLTLKGHRTSVSLEPEFWDQFCKLAAAQGLSVNALAADLDGARDIGLDGGGLASAMRVFVLRAALGALPPGHN